MIRKWIVEEFGNFIDYPEGSDGRFVTTKSCQLFAEHIAEIFDQRIEGIKRDREEAQGRLSELRMNSKSRIAELERRLAKYKKLKNDKQNG